MDYLTGIQVAFKGIGITLSITAVGVLIGICVGLILALMKMSKIKPLKWFASVYIEIVRGTPLFVQALIIYFGLPSVLQGMGVDFKWTVAEVAGMIVCGINSSAYVAEIIRSGLQAVDIGQTEAARSLGMTHFQNMWYIVIPQAFKVIMPALGNEFITLMKDTSILSVITVAEITRKGMLWASTTFKFWPAYLGVAIVYLCMTIPLSRIVALIERRMAQGDRG